MTDRFNQPAAGTENWDGPLNDNFADLGIEVADEVASWADLPAPSSEQSSSGNPKVYRVAADDIFVADAGTSWSIIGGLGSADNPLPPSHHKSIHTDETVTDTLAYDYSDQNPQWPRQLEQGGPVWVREYPGVNNPILEEADISATSSGGGVADPLVRWIPELGKYAIFAEYYDGGGIASVTYWTSPTPTVESTWTGGSGIPLASYKTSFPYTFKCAGTWYMTPGVADANDGLKIWELDAGEPSTASDLQNWTLIEDSTITSHAVKDPVIFEFNGYWWLIFHDTNDSNTYCYYADQPVGGSWTSHPTNPVLDAGPSSRIPGGTPIVREHYVDFVDHIINIHRITTLTPSTFEYTEKASDNIAVLTQNGDWNHNNIHTLDVCMGGPMSQPVVIVDGADSSDVFSTGLYTLTDSEPSAATIYVGTDQTATATSYTPVALDSIDHDLRNAVSTTNYNYTIPSKGYYQVSGAVKISNPSATDFSMLAEINSSTYGQLTNAEGHAVVDGNDLTVSIPQNTVGPIPKGETISMRVYNRSASAETIAGGLKNTFLNVRKLDE